jgi:beta-lactamase class A
MMMFSHRLVALAGAMLALPAAAPLAAQAAAEAPAPATASATPLESGAQRLVPVLNGTATAEEAFTAGLLAQVPYAQIAAVGSNLTGQFGPAMAVEAVTPVPVAPNAGLVTIRFERALVVFQVSVDPAEANRMNGLFVKDVRPLGDTPEKIAADLAALPGSVNAWFAPLDGKGAVIGINADTPLALGSTFKLYVLAALAEDVKAGRRKWSDVVPLDQKSYPSGQMQNWPEGAPVTLHTLASLMISISDNTATDQLIAVLGRQRILKLMKDSGHSNPASNDPFLTTRELFVLKTMDPLVLDRWRQRTPDAMTATAVLMEVANPSLDEVNAAFAAGPKAIDIEWFASPADITRLFAHMRKTADPKVFDIMAINPSATPAIKANWDYIGFKGGSEPGVVNLSWLLTDKAGRDWVLTLGWNNPAAVLDQSKLEGIAQRILLLPR